MDMVLERKTREIVGMTIFVPELFVDGGIYHRDRNEVKRLVVVSVDVRVARGGQTTITPPKSLTTRSFSRV